MDLEPGGSLVLSSAGRVRRDDFHLMAAGRSTIGDPGNKGTRGVT
jgi:hypothetical protein